MKEIKSIGGVQVEIRASGNLGILLWLCGRRGGLGGGVILRSGGLCSLGWNGNLSVVVEPVLEGPDVVQSVFVTKRGCQLLAHSRSDTGQTVEDQGLLWRWLVEPKGQLELLRVQAQRARAGLAWDVDGVRNVAGTVLVRLSHVDNDVLRVGAGGNLLHLAEVDGWRRDVCLDDAVLS